MEKDYGGWLGPDEECCDRLAMPALGLGEEEAVCNAMCLLSWPRYRGGRMEGRKSETKQNWWEGGEFQMGGSAMKMLRGKDEGWGQWVAREW